MKVSVSAIEEKTKERMRNALDEHFKYKEGDDLDSVIAEVLNDKEVFTFLSAFLPKGKGLPLGIISYWDDTAVQIHYGLTIDFDHTPKRIYLYAQETTPSGPCENLNLFQRFPNYSYKYGPREETPTPQAFIKLINEVLQRKDNNLVDLDFYKR